MHKLFSAIEHEQLVDWQVNLNRGTGVVLMYPHQLHHHFKMAVLDVYKGFRTADFAQGDFHRHFKIVVVGRHQGNVAGAHAKPVISRRQFGQFLSQRMMGVFVKRYLGYRIS